MTTVGYAYPWDFAGDPDAATRVAGLGLDAVAIAATYHGARTSSPLHPTRRLFDAPHSASYIPVHADVWAGSRLRPRESTWTATNDAFGDAQRQLAALDVAVRSWTPLTHVDVVDERDGELCVTNAFGDRLPYALCPSNDDVVHYARTLTVEVARATSTHDIVIEALGPSGVEHAGVHEKTDFANWSKDTQSLLSLCFCRGCTGAIKDAGLDVEALRERVRRGVDGGVALNDALGEFASPLARVRLDINNRLLRLVVDDLRGAFPRGSITLHSAGTPWTTGSFTWLDSSSASDGLSLVAYGWEKATALEEVRALASAAAKARAVGVYLRLDRDWSDPAANAVAFSEFVRAGLSEVHLYHLGLLSAGEFENLRRVLAQVQAALP